MSEPAGAGAPQLAEAAAQDSTVANENQHEASAEASSTAAGEAAMMDVEIPALPPAAVADDGGDGGMPPLGAAAAAAAAEAAAAAAPPAAPPAQAVRYVPFFPSCRVPSCHHHMPLRTPSCFGRCSSSLCSFLLFTCHASINKHLYRNPLSH